MTRLIVIAVIVAAAIWLLRRAIAGPHRKPDGGVPPASTDGELVACAQCGVNLPKAEARNTGERFYCSEEHSRLGPRDG